MKTILRDLSADGLVKKAIKANWENYHYCLGQSSSVELSIGRYLTWFITNMPDHFMNLVVCTQYPQEGANETTGGGFEPFPPPTNGERAGGGGGGGPGGEKKKGSFLHWVYTCRLFW